MRVPFRLIATTATVVTALAVSASAANASLYTRLLGIYENHATIPACEFSIPQLESVLKSTDTYEAQYFGDFTNAITAAITQRASGGCNQSKTSSTSTTVAAGGTGPGPTGPPVKLGPVTAATGAGVPAPIVILAVLALVLLVFGAVSWVVHLGWDPPWAENWDHAWNEAWYRVAGRWSAGAHRFRPRRR